MTTTNGAELRQIIEVAQAYEAERKAINKNIADHWDEAEARGYDTKALKAVKALMEADPDKLAEHEAITDTYKQALGL